MNIKKKDLVIRNSLYTLGGDVSNTINQHKQLLQEMTMRSLCIPIVFFLLLLSRFARGEEGQRIWIDKSGTFKTNALLDDVAITISSVSLKLESGNIKEVPFDKLSKSDQSYVRNQILYKFKTQNHENKTDKYGDQDKNGTYNDDKFRAELIKTWIWGSTDDVNRLKNAVIGAKATVSGINIANSPRTDIKEDTRWLLEKIGPNKSSLLNGKSGNEILRAWAVENSQKILQNSGKTNFIFPENFEDEPDAEVKLDLLISFTWGNQQERTMVTMAVIGARAIAAGATLTDLKIPGQKQAVKDLLEKFGNVETTLFFGKTGTEVLCVSTKRELMKVLQADIDPNTGSTVYNTPFGKISKSVLEEELDRLFGSPD